MGVVFEHRIEEEAGKRFKVYKVSRPSIWITLWLIPIISIVLGFFLANGWFVVFGFLWVGMIFIVAEIEGKLISADPRILYLRRKEFRMKGRLFDKNNPAERWVET